MRIVFLGIVSLVGAALAQAQSAGAAPPQPAATTPPATTTAPPLFKTRVDLVTVPVVIRDSKGRAIGTFQQEDFQLFDKGKPQTIVKFSVEKGPVASVVEPDAKGKAPEAAAAPAMANRFVAFLFDDIHVQYPDLIRAREAAGHNLEKLGPSDRAGIFTTSGQGQLDFTADRNKLNEALDNLMPRPLLQRSGLDCPDLSYYMADAIVNKNDRTALQVATTEVNTCGGRVNSKMAISMAQAAAYRVIAVSAQESRGSLVVLRELVRRMSGLPGQRTIVIVSPGFLTLQQQPEKMEVLDRAVKANVRINALDARGLYPDPTIDASRRGGSVNFIRLMGDYDRDAAMAQADVMAEMASGTGGTFFQHNNDFDEGFRRLVSPPEFTYILGFTPDDLKNDGGFHGLKVKIAHASSSFEIDARRGYYAPKTVADPAVMAKEEMLDALFTREQMNEIPVQMRSELAKEGEKQTIGVFLGVDSKGLRFHKEEGKNINTLTVLSGLFDSDGNLRNSNRKTVDLHLQDDVLQKLAPYGISVRTDYDVTPGRYLLRVVVRDSESQAMSAISGTVVIP